MSLALGRYEVAHWVLCCVLLVLALDWWTVAWLLGMLMRLLPWRRATSMGDRSQTVS